MKKKQEKKIKKYWLQDSGIYQPETFMFFGMDKKEISKVLKRYSETEQLIDTINKDDWDFGGMVLEADNKKRALIMPEFRDEWRYWDMLLHEVHHLTLYLGKQFGFVEEFEASAYLFGYLFTKIRRRLYNEC